MSTAIYRRVARNDHGQLDTQTQRLHTYAAEHDLAVTATFSDVGPGTDPDRPGLARLLAAARAGQFDHVLVGRLDRLDRSAYQLAGVLYELARAGITLLCVAEPSGIITITPDGMAVIRLRTVDDAAPHTAHAVHMKDSTRRRRRR